MIVKLNEFQERIHTMLKVISFLKNYQTMSLKLL